MEEEVIIEDVVVVEEEEIVEEVTQEEIAEEEDEFNPDELEFEDSVIIGDINFDEFKEQLDLTSDERIGMLTSYVQPYIDKGFTEEQIKFIIQRDLEFDNGETDNSNPKKKTATEIKEMLNTQLSTEERKNYQSINRFASEIFKDTEFAKDKKEFMEDPKMIKMLNVIYKKSLGKTSGDLSKVSSRVSEKKISSISFDEAYEQINEALKYTKDIKPLINELRGKVADKEKFNSLLSIIGEE